MNSIRVPIVEKILSANDQLATQNRLLLKSKHVFSINIMASPGAGKTSFILQTIKGLENRIKVGVIEGDTAAVTIDADKISEVGIPAVQINTGGDCHLDAVMVAGGMQQLPLDDIDLMIIENVGNLVCPAAFDLGTNINILIASVPEGDDKPYKYPAIYRGIDVLILNKMDLLPYIKFSPDYFKQGVEMLNPNLKTFPVSCSTGEGIDQWLNWLETRVKEEYR
ncbi:MAG TPA: hydrogenase nickel incorporation protein HypB [Leptolinea sp.]